MNYENKKPTFTRNLLLGGLWSSSAYHLKYNILLQIGSQMHGKCVPICNNLLQIVTQLHCKCVSICNNLLQIGTQLHYICVPICNNVLQIGTFLQIVTQQTPSQFDAAFFLTLSLYAIVHTDHFEMALNWYFTCHFVKMRNKWTKISLTKWHQSLYCSVGLLESVK